MSSHDEVAIRQVTVLGAGQSGLEIALQCAAFGVSVCLFDSQPTQLASVRVRSEQILDEMSKAGTIGPLEAKSCFQGISLRSEVEEAGRKCDLLIEAVTEDINVKREVLRRFHPICPPQAIFATNTSFLLPSSMAHASGRPERFAGFHFHTPVWKANVVDVMPHRLTSESTVERLLAFGRQIGQTPIHLHREVNGYVYNRMSLPMLLEALQLAASNVASVEDIDRAWMGVTKMPVGPLGMLDSIGLDTVCKIATYWGEVLGDKSVAHSAEYLNERIASGKLGVKTNEGFYRYPNPSFQNEGFVVDSDRRSPQGPRHHQRFLLKLVEAAVHPQIRPKFAPTGAALVVGECATSQELAEHLAHQGLDVHRIVGDSVSNVAASFGELIEQGPVDHLFCFAQKLECLRDPRQFDEQIIGEFELVRNWYQHLVSLNRLDSATFTGITYLGGDFGVNGPPAQPLGGALVGLARALFVEGAASNSLGPRTKVVDLPANSTPSDDVAKILLETAISQASVVTGSRSELIDRLANTEVGYAEGRRQVIRLVADKVSFFSVPALKPGQWIFTGGARGITAEVARTMGRQCGVSLHLVGRSLLPETDYTQLSEEELDQLKRDVMTNAYREGRKPNAAWDVIARGMECQRNIQRMRDDGIEVTYHSCDVCDRAAVEQLFAEVRKHGPVRGIVHGAGVQITCRIEKKEKAGIRATIGPKALGTLALMEESYDDPLEFFVAFGSLAGRFGGSGRADNLLANELQAKLIGWYRGHRPECKSVLFHWPGWAEVGMSARPESRRGLLARDHNLLSTADGVRFFMHELAIGAPSSEVAIIDEGELPPAWRHKESTNT